MKIEQSSGPFKVFRRESRSIEEEASVVRKATALETGEEGHLRKVTVGESHWIRIHKGRAEPEQRQLLLDRLSEELVARHHDALDLGSTRVRAR